MHFKHFRYGHRIHVITGHKPLVSLFRKSLVNTSPRLSRMLVQLLDYSLDVIYQLGEMMHLSDALSQLSSHNSSNGKTIQSVSVDKIHQHTNSDNTLQMLISHINNV